MKNGGETTAQLPRTEKATLVNEQDGLIIL
jgi:hypothetical protein